MTSISKSVLLLAVSVAFAASGSHVFAKTVGPTRVQTSGVSAAPPGAGGSHGKYIPYCKLHPGRGGCPPKADQPPCRGPHRGPNGVIIQCD